MPSIHRLTPLKVKNAKPGSKLEDGGGLRLVVSQAGGKKWVLRYQLSGKRREMGLGGFPTVGLQRAREMAQEARDLLQQGKDPIPAKRAEPAQIPTFTSCAARYIRAHRRGWKNRKHAQQWVRTLKTYARPVVGHKRVDAVTTEEVLKILTPIWTAKPETAKRVQGRIENVLDYASAHRYRDPLNPARWRGHLDKLLPKPTRVRTVRNHPAMPHNQVAEFMRELRTDTSAPSLALQYLILTAARTSEVLYATWEEIDLEARRWTVPAERMKAKRAHTVPLSDAALAVLEKTPRIDGNAYIFPGSRAGRPLSTMALLVLMRAKGYGVGGKRGPYVPHGFRSSFRDWCGEVSSFPRDVAEMALAHSIPDKTEAAYRRGNLLEKRRFMMAQWATYATSTGAEVVQIRKAQS